MPDSRCAHGWAPSVWRIRQRSGAAGSRSTTWIGGHAHGRTPMPGTREKPIRPRVPSTATRGQIELLDNEWSPEQIVGHLRLTHAGNPVMRISHESIYRAIYTTRWN
ncbi:hypothetical protein [Nonomuraea longispora]|uniref:hypothetical protein n=1 Tax=Nonomuraea longispora TaxID=1848320 RepID=UPI0014047BCF|nr:hypothetical protein [Nonomuraea longispora]